MLKPVVPADVDQRRQSMRFALAVLLAISVLGSTSAVAAPFRIAWVHGTCRNCETARYLVDVPFFSATEAWAIGFNPPGETGEGDATVMHSRNGGRTWSELHGTYTHNAFPTVSFAGPLDGWLMHFDLSAAEERLTETHDGGRHWRRLPNPDDHLRQVQYLGHGQGIAYAFDIYKKVASFYVIAGQDRWRRVALPFGFAMDQMSFADLNHGLLAGCRDREVTVLATADGGQHWTSSALDLPRIGDQTSTCDGYEVVHVTGDANGHAWLLVTKHSFMKGDTAGYASAWSSIDSGRTWTKAFERRFDTSADFSRLQDFEGPYDFKGGPPLLAHNVAQTHPSILYREPSGGWLDEPMKRALGGCSPTPGGLACAAGQRGFWVASLSH
jgi:hypothetical protein